MTDSVSGAVGSAAICWPLTVTVWASLDETAISARAADEAQARADANTSADEARTTMMYLPPDDIVCRSTRGFEFRYPAMRRRPFRRLFEKAFDLVERAFRKVLVLARDAQHVPPGREIMQRDAEFGHLLTRMREDVVEEEDENMRAGLLRLP